jgi:hypothetical protein
VLGGRVDDDVGSELDGAEKTGVAKTLSGDHEGALGMGEVGHRLDVDDLQGRVRDGLEEHRLVPGRIAARHWARSVPSTKVTSTPVAAQHVLEHVKAGAEQRARADHVVAGAEHGHERARDGGHAGGGGEAVLGPSSWAMRCSNMEVVGLP